MRLWICFAVIASTLMGSSFVAGDDPPNYHFALLEDCQLVIAKDADALRDNVNPIKAGDYKGSNCKYSQLLYVPEEPHSNVMVFTPGDLGDTSGKPTKNMQVYGATIDSLRGGNETATVNISKDFEVIDFSYALPESCSFVPDRFKVGFDVNVIHMMVKCGGKHFSLLRSQVNFEKFVVFTPKTWLVHFDKDPLPKIDPSAPCAVNRHVFVPRKSNIVNLVGDSYVLRYCDDLTSKKLVSYATPLHNIMEKVYQEFLLDVESELGITNQKIEDMNFYGASAFTMAFTMKFSASEFFIGLIDAEKVEDPAQLMNSAQKSGTGKLAFGSHAKVVAVGREDYNGSRRIFTHAEGDPSEWKFRTQQDPELQQGLEAFTLCNYVEHKEKFDECMDDYKAMKTVNIVLISLIAFEVVLIVATIAIFAFCIFVQRKRRRRHREIKAARRGGKHGKHGDKHGKKNKKDQDPETDGTNNTNKSTEKTPKTSKKENDNTKTGE